MINAEGVYQTESNTTFEEHQSVFEDNQSPRSIIRGCDARSLLDYTPPVKEAEVRAEYQKLGHGIELSGFNFKRGVPAKVSNTYLLRSISIDRSDIAVAFRVVRKDTDGSLILVFKELKNFPKPTMERTQTATNKRAL